MEFDDIEFVESTLLDITDEGKIDAGVDAILFTTEVEVSISDVGLI